MWKRKQVTIDQYLLILWCLNFTEWHTFVYSNHEKKGQKINTNLNRIKISSVSGNCYVSYNYISFAFRTARKSRKSCNKIWYEQFLVLLFTRLLIMCTKKSILMLLLSKRRDTVREFTIVCWDVRVQHVRSLSIHSVIFVMNYSTELIYMFFKYHNATLQPTANNKQLFLNKPTWRRLATRNDFLVTFTYTHTQTQFNLVNCFICKKKPFEIQRTHRTVDDVRSDFNFQFNFENIPLNRPIYSGRTRVKGA